MFSDHPCHYHHPKPDPNYLVTKCMDPVLHLENFTQVRKNGSSCVCEHMSIQLIVAYYKKLSMHIEK